MSQPTVVQVHIANGIYRIRNYGRKNSSAYLSAGYNNVVEAGELSSSPAHQEWKIEAVDRDDGTFKIFNTGANDALNAQPDSSGSNKPPVLGLGGPSVKWTIESRGAAFIISTADQRKVIDLPDSGNVCILWDSIGGTNQRWILELVKSTDTDKTDTNLNSWQLAHKNISAGTYYIRNRVKNSQLVLWFLSDLPYAPVVVWPTVIPAGPERKWEVRMNEGGGGELLISSIWKLGTRYLTDGPKVNERKNPIRLFPVPQQPGWYFISPTMSNPPWVIADPNATGSADMMVCMKPYDDRDESAMWELVPASP